MPDTFDISQQPSPAGIGKPSSGSYGDVANLDRLKKSFPTAPPGAGPDPGQMAPPPMPTPSTGPPAGAPAGLPAALMTPTTRPDVPASTPLSAGPPQSPVAGAVSERQKRLAVLDAIVNNPTVSAATKEWAQINLDALIQGSRQ